MAHMQPCCLESTARCMILLTVGMRTLNGGGCGGAGRNGRRANFAAGGADGGMPPPHPAGFPEACGIILAPPENSGTIAVSEVCICPSPQRASTWCLGRCCLILQLQWQAWDYTVAPGGVWGVRRMRWVAGCRLSWRLAGISDHVPKVKINNVFILCIPKNITREAQPQTEVYSQ